MMSQAHNVGDRILDERYDLGERFRPWTSDLVVGNREKVESAAKWLDSLERTHDGHFRAALILHGPPGCGKTSTIRALLRDRGYAFKEWSPADPFSARVDADAVSMARHFREVYEGTVFTGTKTALILEEVDGVQLPLDEMLACLGRTRPKHNPVLITCNRLYSPELRKLREHPAVANLAFYPLRNRDLRELWARWDEFWRWKELQAGGKPPVPIWTEAQLELELQHCRGDARRLLARDADARRRAGKTETVSETAVQYCDWRDVERWKNSRDVRFRRNALPELASLWKDARRWMGDKYHDEQLFDLAESDKTLGSLSTHVDVWSACDVLDAASWQDDQIDDGLGEILACVQLLSLCPTNIRSDKSASKNVPRTKFSAVHRRTSPGQPDKRRDWDLPRALSEHK
jgi:hypothetical protein